MNIEAAMQKAEAAAKAAIYEITGDNFREADQWGACGFAWVNVYADGRSKFGRALKKAGMRKSYDGSFQIWNPGGYPGQRIDIKEKAATAYAKVLRAELGFDAVYAGSRLD